MTSSFAKRALVLGLLTAIGPFAIDMYVPALPGIAADLKTSTAATQYSLIAFMIAVSVSQVFYGPLADVYGRKAPIYFGMSLFAVGSIGCMFAPSIEWLIFFRFVQGVGSTAGMVITRAIVRDLHTGIEAARLMSLIMLVFSTSPILAPLVGSLIIAGSSWRGVFVFNLVAALLGLVLLFFALRETLPAEKRLKSNFRTVAAGYRSLFGDRHFLGLSFIGGLGMASFFSYIATSPFVYMTVFGMTPTEYSIAFGINAAGFFATAQFTPNLARRYGFGRVVIAATTAFAGLSAVLFALVLLGFGTLPVLIVMLMASFAFLGMVIPSTAVLAMENHGPIAGIASALMGTLQLVCGVVVMGLVSLFFDGTALPMVVAILACAVAATVLARFTLSPKEIEAPAE